MRFSDLTIISFFGKNRIEIGISQGRRRICINAGKDYSRFMFYYRGKNRKKTSGQETDSEIDMIIEENNTLYPIEIKKTGNVRADMASAFPILDKDLEKKRGMGAIICRSDYRLKLRDNLIALPIEYI